MGHIKEALYEQCEKSNLPEDAFSGNFHRIDIRDDWLRHAETWEQETALKVWFLARYYDPGEITGLLEHIQHYGIRKPASALPVLTTRFQGRVADRVIASVAAELDVDGGARWAMKMTQQPDDYDDDFAITVEAHNNPLQNTVERVRDVKNLLSITAPPTGTKLVRNLALGAAISALESFLWETMVYWVENDEDVVKRITTTHPHFKDKEFKLKDIFEKRESLQTDILGHMQSVVWHNTGNVAPLYKYGLGITDLHLDDFKPSVLKRHDIVHRSGMTKDGKHVAVAEDEILALCAQVIAFAERVSVELERRVIDPPL